MKDEYEAENGSVDSTKINSFERLVLKSKDNLKR